jgi:serine protease Do
VPINRGNSGGPLFNLQGQVVGINSQIYSNTGNYQGVAFSIPIDVAMSAWSRSRRRATYRAVCSVSMSARHDDMVKALQAEQCEWRRVVRCHGGSAAAKAGIQAGDIILSYNGKPINQASDLPPLVGMTKPGTKVPVQIMRDGAEAERSKWRSPNAARRSGAGCRRQSGATVGSQAVRRRWA